jgi:membrane protein
MARLRDVPKIIRKVGFIPLTKRIYGQINGDNLFVWASALAYSWLFAVFPFFIFLLTLLPYLPAEYKNEAQLRIHEALEQLPRDAYKTVWPVVHSRLDQLLNQPPRGAALIGILVTLWAASGGMAMTMSALDRTYDVKKLRPFYKQRPLAIVLTVIAAVSIVAVIVLIPIGTIAINWLVSHTEFASDWLAKRMGPFSTIPNFVKNHVEVIVALWQIIRFGLAFVLMFGLVSIVYHFGPNIRQKYRILTPGSVFTIAVWMLLGVAFRMYVDRFGKYNETYGTVGGVAILLLFFYIDSLVLLIGAEINSEMDYECLGVERGTYDFRSAEKKMIEDARERARAAKTAAIESAEPPPAPSA